MGLNSQLLKLLGFCSSQPIVCIKGCVFSFTPGQMWTFKWSLTRATRTSSIYLQIEVEPIFWMRQGEAAECSEVQKIMSEFG